MYLVEISLVAVAQEVDPAEIWRHWNLKETPTLDAIVGMSPALRIGTTVVIEPDNADSRGPVGRIESLISLRGTMSGYVLPEIDDDLIGEIKEAFRPLPNDPPFDLVPKDGLEAFLLSHRGAKVLYTSRLVEQGASNPSSEGPTPRADPTSDDIE